MHRCFAGAMAWNGRPHRTAPGLGLLLGLSLLTGCSSPFFRGKNAENESVAELIESTTLVGDIAVPFGLRPMRVEAVAVVNGLPGTGSDPPPSPQRDRLLGEIQTHEVDKPSTFLASPTTSMVFIKAMLPPGAQKGDRVDVEVRLPPRSETSDLRGGWLMPARLREMQVLGNSLRSGHDVGLASGPVIVDAIFHDDESGVYKKRGRVLGGGVSLIERPLGLALNSKTSSVQTSTVIGNAVNARFHHTQGGLKRGVATPKEDDFIAISMHPRYKHNLNRYMAVIRSIAIRETPADRVERMAQLKKQLAEPISASRAALQLEAIGREAVPVLKEGTRSLDPQVRFHAAEALAYLDEAEAAETLADTAAKDPSLRWRALMALAVMDHLSAYDALVGLLDSPSVETRYGAFYSLRLRNPNDPLVRGEVLSDSVAFHRIPSTADFVIHFSRSKRPEIVVFGIDATMTPPAYLFAGKDILVKGTGDGRLRVSRFTLDRDIQEICAADAEAMIRTIIRLGGDYADVLEAVQAAKASGDLTARVAINARPDGRRTRASDSEEDEDPESIEPEDEDEIGTGLADPEALAKPPSKPPVDETREFERDIVHDVDAAEQPKRSFLSRIWRPFGN